MQIGFLPQMGQTPFCAASSSLYCSKLIPYLALSLESGKYRLLTFSRQTWQARLRGKLGFPQKVQRLLFRLKARTFAIRFVSYLRHLMQRDRPGLAS